MDAIQVGSSWMINRASLEEYQTAQRTDIRTPTQTGAKMLIEIDASKSIQCVMCGEQHPATTDYFIRVNTTTIHDRCLVCFDVFLGKERRI